jgi:hypothetical protein
MTHLLRAEQAGLEVLIILAQVVVAAEEEQEVKAE